MSHTIFGEPLMRRRILALALATLALLVPPLIAQPNRGQDTANPSLKGDGKSSGKLRPQRLTPAPRRKLDLSEVRRRSQAWHRDDDGDGIADQKEQLLIQKFAPELRLAPTALDSARPASVDWYLQRVSMRFAHDRGCSDCRVVRRGKVRQADMLNKTHRMKGGFPACRHKNSPRSSRSSKHFFLQSHGKSTKRGADYANWQMYAHVNRMKRKAGPLKEGYYIQYWFFYPFNPGCEAARVLDDHHADWEHITVFVDASEKVVSIFYGQHKEGKLYFSRGDNKTNGRHFVRVDDDGRLSPDGTHPVVYSAAGTHASYPSAGSFSVPNPVADIFHNDRTANGGPVWQAWRDRVICEGGGLATTRSVVNVGEKDRPLNGQNFIVFPGRWGQRITLSTQRAPWGPATGPDPKRWDGNLRLLGPAADTPPLRPPKQEAPKNLPKDDRPVAASSSLSDRIAPKAEIRRPRPFRE